MAKIIPFHTKDDLWAAGVLQDFLAMEKEAQATMIAMCIGILHLAVLKKLLFKQDLIEMFMETMKSIKGGQDG